MKRHGCASTVITDVICKCSGTSQERRMSLSSPTSESNQDEESFKLPRSQGVLNFGHICPADAPLPIRPYHAIIEGSDKSVDLFLLFENKMFYMETVVKVKQLHELISYFMQPKSGRNLRDVPLNSDNDARWRQRLDT